MSKTVLIRADGGKNIGMGHLSRASLISNYLNRNFSINSILLLKNNQESLKFLEQNPIKTELLPQDISIDDEIKHIKELIQNKKCSLFVLDVLDNDINIDFTTEIRSLKVPFAAITDDSFKRTVNADVIINGNPCQEQNYYLNEKGNYYVGSEYFIMDENYGHLHSSEPAKEINNILLTVGGSDHNNLIFKIVEAIEKLENNYTITLITSHGTGYISKLKEYIKSCRNNINLLIDIPGIIDEWGNCDLAITAGGNTLFERIAARKPGVTICQLERQMEIADKFESLGVNYNLGFGPSLTVEEIYTKLEAYLPQYKSHLDQFKFAGQYVDGKGLSRVALIFKNLIK